MESSKKPDPISDKERAKEKRVEEILRNADLKKFDPELDEAVNPPKPAADE
ncbi:MAG: hypothetical protein ABSG46_09860 [Candidatus Binataceae bacterium]|jgi:hypothetical protein